MTMPSAQAELGEFYQRMLADVDDRIAKAVGRARVTVAAQDDGTVITNNHRILNFQGAGVTITDDPVNRRTNIVVPGAPTATSNSVFVSTAGAEKTFPLASFGATPPTNWQTTGFSDGSWAASAAESVSNSSFYTNPPGSTWITDTTKNGNLGTGAVEELVRRTFALPAGTITAATLDINIDDDLQLSSPFINGNSLTVTRSGGTPVNYATVSIPIGWLTAGANNVLAIAFSSSNGELCVSYRITVTYTGGGADPQYELVAHKGAVSGYAGLDSGSKVPSAQLGSGTPSGTTFLRGDQTWATLSASSISIREIDTAPTVTATVLELPNGTLTDMGGGVARYTPSSPSGLYTAIVIVQDQKSTGTEGGGFTSGAWRTRDLNTEVTDSGSNASVASNQITLAAGTYDVYISCPAYAVGRHAARLQDITNTATLLSSHAGGISTSTGATGVMSLSIIEGTITLSGSTVLEIQHQCSSTKASDGLGTSAGAGFTVGYEVYTTARFLKR